MALKKIAISGEATQALSDNRGLCQAPADLEALQNTRKAHAEVRQTLTVLGLGAAQTSPYSLSSSRQLLLAGSQSWYSVRSG